MDGSELYLNLISGSNTTVEQLQKQIIAVTLLNHTKLNNYKKTNFNLIKIETRFRRRKRQVFFLVDML